jgi:hypothetical protein
MPTGLVRATWMGVSFHVGQIFYPPFRGLSPRQKKPDKKSAEHFVTVWGMMGGCRITDATVFRVAPFSSR